MLNYANNALLFLGKSLENIDPKFKILCTRSPPIVLKPDYIEKPKSVTSEHKKNSRRSFLLHCSDKSFIYQKLSFDEIKEVYKATLPNQDKVAIHDVIIIFNIKK